MGQERQQQASIRLLYITSVCDPAHTVSASAFAWANALAARCREVHVVALDTGGKPASNVSLHSLHRHKGRSRRVMAAKLMELLFNLVPKVDVIFCQYSTKFVFAASPFAILFGKPIVFWWSHGHVDWRLRLATSLVSAVVTASDESFMVKTDKKRVIGHGIDVETFSPGRVVESDTCGTFRILSLGRIAPVKDVETVIRAAAILKERNCRFTLDLIGDIDDRKDVAYAGRMKSLVHELGLASKVRFPGQVSNLQVAEFLRGADAFVNAQAPGGVGRAWLEAMAVGLPVVLCTPALNNVLDWDIRQKLIFKPADTFDLADKLTRLSRMTVTERRVLGQRLRKIVVTHHSLDRLADSILSALTDSLTGPGSLDT